MSAKLNRREQTLWDQPQWTVVVSGEAGVRRFQPRQPFVLIGSHPQCEISLDDPRLPPLAYLLCVVGDQVQTWPLAPLAMARSGPLAESETLRVGNFRISIELHASDSEQLDCDADPVLEIRRLDQRWTTTLRRPVTIMGDDHPSLMRIRGAGLRPCHGAFISHRGQLWFLNFQTKGSSGTKSLRLLSLGQALRLGELTVARLSNRDPEPVAAQKPSPSPTAGTPPATGNTVPLEAYAEGFTNEITYRTIRIGKRRRLKRRLLRAAGLVLVTIIAAMVVLQIYNAVKDQLGDLGGF